MKVLDAASKGWTLGEMYMVLDEAGEHIASAEYIWGDSVPDRDVQAANFAIITHAREMLEMIKAFAMVEYSDEWEWHLGEAVDVMDKVENTYKELRGETE